MGLLPNADFAIVPIEKLRDYALNPAHPVGKHKARVFESVFGLTSKDALFLQEIIYVAIKANPAKTTRLDEFGQRYQVEFILEHNGRTAVVLTAWIVETNDFQPRLSSCYIK